MLLNPLDCTSIYFYFYHLHLLSLFGATLDFLSLLLARASSNSGEWGLNILFLVQFLSKNSILLRGLVEIQRL